MTMGGGKGIVSSLATTRRPLLDTLLGEGIVRVVVGGGAVVLHGEVCIFGHHFAVVVADAEGVLSLGQALGRRGAVPAHALALVSGGMIAAWDWPGGATGAVSSSARPKKRNHGIDERWLVFHGLEVEEFGQRCRRWQGARSQVGTHAQFGHPAAARVIPRRDRHHAHQVFGYWVNIARKGG